MDVRSLARQLVSLLLGAKKSTRAPKSRRVVQLRKDMARSRLHSFEHLLEIAFADVDAGENPSDVAAAFLAAAGMIHARAERKIRDDLGECIKAETEVEGRKKNLEVAILCGDRSTSNLAELEQTIEEDVRTLREEEAAVVHARFPEARRAIA